MEPPKPPQWVQEGLPLKGGPQRIFLGGVRRELGGEMGTPKPPQWVQEGLPYIEGPQKIFWGGSEGMGGELRPQSHPNGYKRGFPI